MAVRIDKLPGQRLVIITYSGTLTRSDLRHVASSLYDTPSSTVHVRTFIDLSTVVQSEVSFSDILGFVARVRETRRMDLTVAAKVVLYAPTSLTFGTARMYQQLAEAEVGLSVFVSADLREALDCIALDALPALPDRSD